MKLARLGLLAPLFSLSAACSAAAPTAEPVQGSSSPLAAAAMTTASAVAADEKVKMICKCARLKDGQPDDAERLDVRWEATPNGYETFGGDQFKATANGQDCQGWYLTTAPPPCTDGYDEKKAAAGEPYCTRPLWLRGKTFGCEVEPPKPDICSTPQGFVDGNSTAKDAAYADQKKYCYNSGSLSCNDARLGCDDAKARADLNEKCMDARRRVRDTYIEECRDAGHQVGIGQVQASLDGCRTKIRALCTEEDKPVDEAPAMAPLEDTYEPAETLPF